MSTVSVINEKTVIVNKLAVLKFSVSSVASPSMVKYSCADVVSHNELGDSQHLITTNAIIRSKSVKGYVA